MTSFSFVATKKDGSTLSSTIESSDRAAAIRSIQAQGLKLVNLKETDAKPGRKRRRKIKSDELVMFTRQLSSMVSAGVPILRSLESMTEHAARSSPQSLATSQKTSKAVCRLPMRWRDTLTRLMMCMSTWFVLVKPVVFWTTS